MKTTNIISTPDITGNIGSCKVNSITSQVGNTFFTEKFQTTILNSCTGEVINTSTYTTYGGICFFSLLVFLLLVIPTLLFFAIKPE